MGDLSQNFNRSEFACNCGCGSDTVDAELVQILEAVRRKFDQPLIVTSGCRCPAFNMTEGGAVDSQHLYGRAADFYIEGIPHALVQEACEDVGCGGLGCYTSFTHVDSRTGYARW